VFISPEHFELNQKYQKLLLKNMQMEKLIEKKDEEYKLLLSKITSLQKFEHQYQQLQRLVYARSSEKSSTTPGQLLLECYIASYMA
jgi:hypothetical protein